MTNPFDTYEDLVTQALDAHAQGDYAAFEAVASEAFLSRVSESGFLRAHASLGHLIGGATTRRDLGWLRRDGAIVLLIVLGRDDESDEILVQIGIRDADDGPEIDWMWIE